MSERYGKCSNCQGKGKVYKPYDSAETLSSTVESVEDREGYTVVVWRSLVRHSAEVRECGRCGGTGFSGQAV